MDRAKAEDYTPPAVSVIGSLSEDTRGLPDILYGNKSD
jgi:hypothetical protein